jgi:thiol-disulfide isomerase/thioredoxin
VPDRSEQAAAGGLVRWLPLLILPLLGVVAALAVLLTADGSPDGPAGDDAARPGAGYPTPAPVTFIPPTPLPETPWPTESFDPAGLIAQPVPDFTLATLDGGTVRLPDLSGQVVFLNFWATWCTPCQAEMPALQALQDAHPAEVRVLAVTNPDDGQTKADIRAFMADYDLTLTVALSTDLDLYRRFGVYQIPVTYLLDRDGVIRYRHLGELRPDDIATYLELLAVS